MEIKEISLVDNPLLKRKELVLKVVAEAATPKKNELADKVSAIYNVSDKKLIVIESIKTSFGKLDCKASVKIYASEEALKSIEPQPKAKADTASSNTPGESGQIKVDLGDSDAPKEEKKEAAPKEEKKEEHPKPEKKKEAPKEEPKPEEKAEEKKEE